MLTNNIDQLADLLDKIIDNVNNIEALELEHKKDKKVIFKLKVVKQNNNHIVKEDKKQKEQTLKNNVINKEQENEKFSKENSKETDDLGGFKLLFIEDNKFFIISTCVGKIKINKKIENENIVDKKTKLAEIEILNVINPIYLEFKTKILDTLVNDNDVVDYGKKLFLMEKIEE